MLPHSPVLFEAVISVLPSALATATQKVIICSTATMSGLLGINSPGHFETMIDSRCDCIGVGVTQYDGITYCYMFVGIPNSVEAIGVTGICGGFTLLRGVVPGVALVGAGLCCVHQGLIEIRRKGK